MALPLPKQPNAASFPATLGELVASFQQGEAVYDSYDTPMAPSQPGADPEILEQAQEQEQQQRNSKASSLKAVQTRKGKFGHTKLKPDTQKKMEKKGFKIDKTANPGGIKPRANK